MHGPPDSPCDADCAGESQQVGATLAGGADAAAEALNRDCFCMPMDPQALARALDSELGQPGLHALLRDRCPYVFAAQPVFVAPAHARRMAEVVQAVESVVALPAYQEQVLAAAPAIARAGVRGPQGVFFGYDFHLAQGHLGLIEINTNAGGAFLAAHAAQAQTACCDALRAQTFAADPEAFRDAVIAQFQSEWRAQFGDAPLKRIAIVDDAPTAQYLYPEFLLAQRMLEAAGITTVIVDASALTYEGGRLTVAGAPVDLVYNRLVDFALDEPRHAALRAAYLDGVVAVTPNPRVHALFADKRNLALLADRAQLESWGVAQRHVQPLVRSLDAELVTPSNAAHFWAARRDYVFKPAAGHGGKGVYRGDKITRGVWDRISTASYIAQRFAPPSRRVVLRHDGETLLKLDVRLYVYDGMVLMAAARLYEGQTTNFRTPGGGFAPVVLL